MDAWIAEHGTQIPWAKAVELISTVMKYPESERNRLLCLDTPDLPKQIAAAQADAERIKHLESIAYEGNVNSHARTTLMVSSWSFL